METESEMYMVNLNGLEVEVDMETAILLENDQIFRENYEKALRVHLPSAESTEPSTYSPMSPSSTAPIEKSRVPSIDTIPESKKDEHLEENVGVGVLVWSSRKPTSTDVQATTYLLEWRKKMINQFDDRKHSKNTLWHQIAKHMNEKNLFVGHGLEGAERCRKKFANLQASYLKYKDKKKETGQGYISKPPFYDELDDILGLKDKIVPQLIIDSTDQLKITEKKTDNKENLVIPLKNTQPPEQPQPSTSKQNNEKNKFANTRSSSKPKDKQTLLEEMIQVQKSEVQERKTEFTRIMSYLEKTSTERHEQVMAILNKTGKKRKRDSDSE